MILIKGSVSLLVALFGAVSFGQNTSFPDLVCPDWPRGHWDTTWANRTCTRHSECPDSKLCCYNGEDRHCTDPTPSRLGPSGCRELHWSEEDCKTKGYPITRICSSGDDCLRTEICCQAEECTWTCSGRDVERPGEPPVIIGQEKYETYNYFTGRNISLLCSGKGEGLQTVTWYKRKNDWFSVPVREAHIVTKVLRGGRKIESRLIIPNAQCSDSGEYQCAIMTELGRRSSMKPFTISIYDRETAVSCGAEPEQQ